MAAKALVDEKDYPEIRIDVGASEVAPLYTDADLDRAADELRALLARDETPATQSALASAFAREVDARGGWFHRIEFPEHALSTTSRPLPATTPDPGPLNTLWWRLDAAQGTRLRPYPKWTYLRRILPPLVGKSVLDIGCSCGFFSFRFAEAGASVVTGIEAIREQCDQARWAAGQLGLDNVTSFRNADAFFDRSIAPHDVVFMSEAFIHSIVPFYALLRCVNLAKEYLIIDDFMNPDGSQPAALRMFRDTSQTGDKIAWTGFAMTEQVLLEFLFLFGVKPEKVKRYRGHNGHVVIVADTREARAVRDQQVAAVSLRSMLALGEVPANEQPAPAPVHRPVAAPARPRSHSVPRLRDALWAVAERLIVRGRRH